MKLRSLPYPAGTVALELDLGRWTVPALDELLKESRDGHADPCARLAHLAGKFLATPFSYESRLPIPPPGMLRVRLSSFGCMSFVITMLALNRARSFGEFIENLRVLRYVDGAAPIDSDPQTGNILDFPYDVFVDNGQRFGFVREVTDEVAGTEALATIRARFTRRRRARRYDPEQRHVCSRFHDGETVSATMIPRSTFSRMDRSPIKTGDVLLFTRVPADDGSDAISEDLLFAHSAIAMAHDDEIFMIHATRDYVWRPGATRSTPPSATGIHHLDDPRREQLGVTIATRWVDEAEGRETSIDGDPYYGYSPNVWRPVFDYMAGARFEGVAVFRPLETP